MAKQKTNIGGNGDETYRRREKLVRMIFNGRTYCGGRSRQNNKGEMKVKLNDYKKCGRVAEKKQIDSL